MVCFTAPPSHWASAVIIGWRANPSAPCAATSPREGVSMFKSKPGWLLAACLALGSATAQAPGDVRIALVIGNGAYAQPATLPNPVNDAKAMGDTLRGLGFEVIEVRDASRAQMLEAVAKVRTALRGKQGIGMLYYAGHGLQLDWRNYMVPVDAKLQSSADVPPQTVEVGAVIDSFKEAGNRMNILVLDACRDNPFPEAASAKGLAQLDAPPGTILAYATAPGNVAADGTGSNGLYTQYLLQELVKPQSRIEDVFKRTRFAVRKASRGRQVPWESTSLEEDFMFNAGKVVAVPAPDNRAREQALAEERAAWTKVKDSAAVEDVFAFLARFPSGSYAEPALARLEKLQRAEVTAQPDRQGRVQGSFDSRFREGDTYEFVMRDGLSGSVMQRGAIEVKLRGEDEYEGVLTSGNVSGGRGNRAGFVLADAGGTYDPPWVLIPAGEYQAGKKMAGRAVRTEKSGQVYWMDYETKVIGREPLQTPLGLIDAWKVETKFVTQFGRRTHITFWYDQDWGYPVKYVSETRLANAAPDIRIREMVARSRRPG
jgi:uncharacterized caspase-like protein